MTSVGNYRCGLVERGLCIVLVDMHPWRYALRLMGVCIDGVIFGRVERRRALLHLRVADRFYHLPHSLQLSIPKSAVVLTGRNNENKRGP